MDEQKVLSMNLGRNFIIRFNQDRSVSNADYLIRFTIDRDKHKILNGERESALRLNAPEAERLAAIIEYFGHKCRVEDSISGANWSPND